MKKLALVTTMFAVSLCLTGLPLLAQGRGRGGGGMGGPGMGNRAGDGHGPDMGNIGRNGRTTQGNNNASLGGRKTPGELLTQNSKLSSKLQSLLPKGANLQAAASGFKNLGQFVAAAHVSHNLGIPFDELKDKIISGDSLGKAIQTLDPNLTSKQVKSEAKKGEGQAKQDIEESKS